jgi:hypothetical protein
MYEELIRRINNFISKSNKLDEKYDPEDDCFAHALALGRKLNKDKLHFYENEDGTRRHAFIQHNNKFYDHKGELDKNRLKREFPGGRNKITSEDINSFDKNYKYRNVLEQAKNHVAKYPHIKE